MPYAIIETRTCDLTEFLLRESVRFLIKRMPVRGWRQKTKDQNRAALNLIMETRLEKMVLTLPGYQEPQTELVSEVYDNRDFCAQVLDLMDKDDQHNKKLWPFIHLSIPAYREAKEALEEGKITPRRYFQHVSYSWKSKFDYDCALCVDIDLVYDRTVEELDAQGCLVEKDEVDE